MQYIKDNTLINFKKICPLYKFTIISFSLSAQILVILSTFFTKKADYSAFDYRFRYSERTVFAYK